MMPAQAVAEHEFWQAARPASLDEEEDCLQ